MDSQENQGVGRGSGNEPSELEKWREERRRTNVQEKEKQEPNQGVSGSSSNPDTYDGTNMNAFYGLLVAPVMIVMLAGFIVGLVKMSEPWTPPPKVDFVNYVVEGIKDENSFNFSGATVHHAKEINKALEEKSTAFVILPATISSLKMTNTSFRYKVHDESGYDTIIFAVQNNNSDTYWFDIITDSVEVDNRLRMILYVGDVRDPDEFLYEHLDDVQAALGTESSQSGDTGEPTDSAE